MANASVHEMTVEDMEQWHMDRKREKKWLDGYTQDRFVKRCSCGNPYSYLKTDKDPKACPECRGEEGELIY